MDWFNQVDATYRGDLRELNELNFARFDAKVGERLAELRADLRSQMESRFAQSAVQLQAVKVSLVRWMFGLCLGTAAAVIGWILASRT